MTTPHTHGGRPHVTIIGAGVVGLSTALAAQRKGCSVTVVDRGLPGHGASFGHAGGIAITWVSPQGFPGLIRKIPGWLLDPLGPVAVRWPYLPRMLPWLAQMWRYSKPSEVERIGDALAALMNQAWPAWERLLHEIGREDTVQHRGALTAYRTHRDLAKDPVPWRMRRDRGFEVSVVDGLDLRDLEPALSSAYKTAVFEPEAKWCHDPMAVIEAMAHTVRAKGGEILTSSVSALVSNGRTVQAIRTSTGTMETEDLVIAAGARSHRFAAQLGRKVPLESERGYHIDLPHPAIKPQQILSLAPHKMVVTPTRCGVRLSGTAEFGGVDSVPNYARARALIGHATEALPGIDPVDYSEWSGDRPILPDSLPVIDRDPVHENVLYAFGHSHVGFTLGPITGEMIADMVVKETPAGGNAGLEVDRFSRRRTRQTVR